MSRKVMEQALEALELCRKADMRTSTLLHAEDAIEAIRTALAEPEPEPDMRHQKIQALLAKSARSNIEIGIVESLLFDPEYQPSFPDSEYWLPIHDEIVRLKNSAPPQRKPLTDEQIDKLPWGPHEGNPMTFLEGLRDFARAVERAHGIE